MHDPTTQMHSLIQYSTRAPGYGRVQNGTMVGRMGDSMETAGGCGDLLRQCSQTKADQSGNVICSKAWKTCVSFGHLAPEERIGLTGIEITGIRCPEPGNR